MGGAPPYKWDIICEYSEVENQGEFLPVTENMLTMTNDDDGYAVIELPFLFPFYGKSYDRVTVITDGSIKLEEGFDYIRSEGDILAFKTITAYGADLMSYPEDGDGVIYSVDVECLTVRWITSMWDQPEIDLDFQVKIYSDSRIEFFYGDSLTTGLAWASGISNGKVTDAVISDLSNTADPSGLKTAFSTDPYPYRLELSSDGVFSGTTLIPETSWNINFRVTDDRNISSIKNLTFTTSTGIEEGDISVISDLKIHNNYPNPFNPSTVISFSTGKPSVLSMKIFNSLGEVVDTVFEDRNFEGGNYSVNWTAGSRLSSGIYFVGLKNENGKSLMKKISLLK
jgi:hypothetical protein